MALPPTVLRPPWRTRRWVAVALLVVLAALSVSLTCDSYVDRLSGWGIFTVNYCVDPGGGLTLCSPVDITWKTSFWGAGHEHNAENATNYDYDLHEWRHGLWIDRSYDDSHDPQYPFLVNSTMTSHVYSYQSGDLGVVLAFDSCPPELNDAQHLHLCGAWSGITNLGNPGGYRAYNAGVQAVGVMPLPLPNDGVEWPWYMYSEP